MEERGREGEGKEGVKKKERGGGGKGKEGESVPPCSDFTIWPLYRVMHAPYPKRVGASASPIFGLPIYDYTTWHTPTIFCIMIKESLGHMHTKPQPSPKTFVTRMLTHHQFAVADIHVEIIPNFTFVPNPEKYCYLHLMKITLITKKNYSEFPTNVLATCRLNFCYNSL